MSQTPAGWHPGANGTVRRWDDTRPTEHTHGHVACTCGNPAPQQSAP